MTNLAAYVEELEARGRFVFTTEEVARALGLSLVAARAAIRRLKAKGALADPHRGVHVVVPPAYRKLGCLPAEQFLPDLMAHLDIPYYAGLLTAAAYHGAAHQRPMVFQAVVPSARRPITCGDVEVSFVRRSDMVDSTTVVRNTPTGVLRVASPATTAVELVGYPEHSGYYDNVATVLAELVESIDGEQLAQEASRSPLAWVQRLGYLLELVEADDLAAHLDDVLATREVFVVALAPWLEKVGAPRDPRWRVAVNIDVEVDL